MTMLPDSRVGRFAAGGQAPIQASDVPTDPLVPRALARSLSVLPAQILSQHFVLVAAAIYLACHAFTIPIMRMGPSWTTWPRLDDFGLIMLAVASLLARSRGVRLSEWRTFRKLLLLANALTLLSFAVGIVLTRFEAHQINVGAYQAFRLFEYTLVFLCFSRLTLTRPWLELFFKVITGVWIFVALISTLNFLEVVPALRLVEHLLVDWERAGDWVRVVYIRPNSVIGPLGFNPMYLANQMCLLSIFLAFGRPRRLWSRSVILAVAFGVIFLSGSRAGLVAFLAALTGSLLLLRHKATDFLALAVAAFIIVLSAGPTFLGRRIDATVQRQSQVTDFEEEASYSGRWDIWRQKLGYIRQRPGVLVYGLGWGGASRSGPNAHMLYLQVLLETGIIGLGFFILLGWSLLRALWDSGTPGRSLAVATCGLLVAAWTQETFYPVAATGSFLGLYLALCGLVAAQAGQKPTPESKGPLGKGYAPGRSEGAREPIYVPMR